MIINTPSATGTRPSRGKVALAPCRATFVKSISCRDFKYELPQSLRKRGGSVVSVMKWQTWQVVRGKSSTIHDTQPPQLFDAGVRSWESGVKNNKSTLLIKLEEYEYCTFSYVTLSGRGCLPWRNAGAMPTLVCFLVRKVFYFAPRSPEVIGK